MKRSILSGGIGIAVLAVTIPAGAVIQNQVSRPRMEPVVDTVVVDLPTTTLETTTPRSEPIEEPKTEPARPTTTEAAPEPKPTRPVEPKPVNFELRLECGTRSVENAFMNVCHWGEPNVGGARAYKVVCEWSAVKRDGVRAYQLWRKVGDGDRELVTTVPASDPRRYFDTNVRPGHHIVYTVAAVDGDGTVIIASDGVRVATPTETPKTTVKPVETTRPEGSEPKTTAGE